MKNVTEKFNLKVNDVVNIIGNPDHMKAAKIIGFTAKRVKLYRLDLGPSYTYYSSPNTIERV